MAQRKYEASGKSEQCQHWYDRDQVIGRGAGDRATIKATVGALKAGDPRIVAEAFGASQEGGVAILSLKRCGSCQEHEPQLTYVVPNGRKKQPLQHYKSMVRADEANALIRALTPEG